MDRNVWIARALAVILILVFTLLFWHLYATLVRIQKQQAAGPRPATTSTAQP